MSELSFELINHASILLTAGAVRLLSDPWYEGTCFKGGWGLRYDNPGAYTEAATATDLWISHYHGDHLHIPTLRKLAALRPDLRVHANVSANFEMVTPLRAAGFKDVRPFGELRWEKLGGELSIRRHPCTGIDNCLVMETPSARLLNFNDCNLPVGAIRQLARRTGPVDVLFTNFNHAYKLLDVAPPDRIKEALSARFLRILDALRPRWVVPFASMHRYLSSDSQDQNSAMLTAADLERLDPRVLRLGFGDVCDLGGGADRPRIKRLEPSLEESRPTLKPRGPSVPFDRLQLELDAYLRHLRQHLGPFSGIAPLLRVRVPDLGKVIAIDLGAARARVWPGEEAHIAAYSATLSDWCSKPYGTDALFVGADFAVLDPDTRAVRRMLLAGDLYDNKLTPLHTAGMLLRPSGWGFLWNRRDEIAAVLAQGVLRVGNRT
ncbi:MAG: hypothetical protein MOGMAGMI_01530 [Candidatus Omnitrophica bacterium]|nr:hypothetical protein [Candidatus Omnitrophota bacterium]